MAGTRKTNPAGSTNSYRADVLHVLGTLKVATADQIQRISAPHLTFRHADKPTPSKRKQARTASHTGALSDMRGHGLSENGGSTETGDTLRSLTSKGLEAASWELRRPATEMGSTARGAGSSGASHPMAVNETVIALLRPKPDLGKLADDPPHIQAAAQAAVDTPPGVGTIGSYWTEVPLPATGTWKAPGKGGAQADLVLTAPQDQVPLLFIEVDNCHETAEELAAKLEKYARFFRRRVKDTDEKERPMWSTRWAVPEHEYGEMPHPPVLLVFNRIGERNPNRTIPRLQELTRHLWKGQWAPEGYHSYDGKIPIVAVGLRSLSVHGPQGPVFLRFGRDRQQPLLGAIGNPRLETVLAREREKARARLREVAREQAAKKAVEESREAAQREARRPSCTGCGSRFSDERWAAAEETDWGRPVDTHPHLCDDCKAVTVASAAPTPGRQEGHQEPLPEWARQEFMRFPRRPRCTECKAAFTDERWKAVERTGWHPLGQEKHPTLCETCAQEYDDSVDNAWPDSRTRVSTEERPEPSPVPRPKSGGWFSRLRS
ncbi:replication-relaxation family protein [Streptomyces californicus]|uniref:replication-relaxation family protein n=1 Tax=Streptomyces californicus TaxID=67351 RepID=UPI0033E57B98